MIDQEFFKKYQRIILWLANTWLGKLYLTSNWDKEHKRIAWRTFDVKKFYRIDPSAYIHTQSHFYACDKCVKKFGKLGIPDKAANCWHKNKTLREHNIGGFFSCNHFARKVSLVMFWLPYWQGKFEIGEMVFRSAYALPIMAFLSWKLKMPIIFGTVSTFNSATGANSPMDFGCGNYGALSASADTAWSNCRSLTSANANAATQASEYLQCNAEGSAGSLKFYILRIFYIFNTGGTITAGATINDTTNCNIAIKSSNDSRDDTNEGGAYISVIQTNPESDSTPANNDFNNVTPAPVTAAQAMTEGVASDQRKNLPVANNTVFTFNLNTTGQGWIADADDTKPAGAVSAGKTRLGLTSGFDITDTRVSAAALKYHWALMLMADGATKPILSVDWTASASGPAKLKTWNGLATAKIKTINGLEIAKVKTINGLV